MRVLLLTNCEKGCNYLVLKKLRSRASHPNKDEYCLGDKALSKKSHSLHILCLESTAERLERVKAVSNLFNFKLSHLFLVFGGKCRKE